MARILAAAAVIAFALGGIGSPIHSSDNAYYKAYSAASLTL